MSGEIKPFRERLREGQEFEDYCCDVLWDNGIAAHTYRSARRQWKNGESRAGIEIKLDKLYQTTGNVFIECRERRNDEGTSHWRPAGIFEETKPWLYVIGDYQQLWIHGVAILKLLHGTGKYQERATATAEGFLLPVSDSDKYSLKVINTESIADPDVPAGAAPFIDDASMLTSRELIEYGLAPKPFAPATGYNHQRGMFDG